MFQYFSALIVYLVILSLIVSGVVYAVEKEEVESINIDGAILADSVSFSEVEQFIDGRYIDGASFDMGSDYTYGSWYLTNDTLRYRGVGIQYSDIYVKGLTPDGGIIRVSYTIDNPNDNRMRFWIQKAGLLDKDSYLLEYTGEEIVIKEGLFKSTIWSIPYSLKDNQIVTTYYNPDTQLIRIEINDVEIGSVSGGLSKIDNTKYYGGIGARDQSSGELTVSSIEGNIRIFQEVKLTDLFSILAGVLFWTVDEKYFPMIFNIIFVKIPIFVIILGIIFWVRGTS